MSTERSGSSSFLLVKQFLLRKRNVRYLTLAPLSKCKNVVPFTGWGRKIGDALALACVRVVPVLEDLFVAQSHGRRSDWGRPRQGRHGVGAPEIGPLTFREC